MLHILKTLFKGRASAGKTVSAPDVTALQTPSFHPKDILELTDSFDLPILLRGQTFTIMGAHTFQFEDWNKTEFLLSSAQGIKVEMTVDESEGDVFFGFFRTISKSEVEKLFDLDEFSRIFDEIGELTIQPKIQEVDFTNEWFGWIDASYHRIFNQVRGSFYATASYEKAPYEKDNRNLVIPSFTNEGEAFDYYYLESDNQKSAIEIDVYPSGRTEVRLVCFLGASVFKSIWHA